jgi:PucR C-terminal helix-turn-helix domain/GGDEF-like domain
MTRSRARVARQLQRAVGDLTKASLARMEREMPWFGELPAEQRAWIGMVLQAGYNSFITWFRSPDRPAPPLAVEVFGTAPRSFAGVITLQQTVAMIRLSIEVAEAELSEAVTPEHAAEVRESILRYGRELAFATADIYAHAAEMRGAWDARLEALVVDSIMRGDADETIRTRASALGWVEAGNVAVVVGCAPEADEAARQGLVDEVRVVAKQAGLDALGAIQGDRLVVVVGGVSDPDKAGALLTPHFGAGPVVVGPVVTDLLQAHVSAASAVAGLRAAVGWPATPAPVTSDDLLAERALAGDPIARAALVSDVYAPLRSAGPELLETLTAYLDQGGSIEATGRVLFVHPNTVRYRLKRVADVTHLSPADARQAFTLRIAVVLGRLEDGTTLPETSL